MNHDMSHKLAYVITQGADNEKTTHEYVECHNKELRNLV
jgi:hypothetical protein